jgi:hypothetical protein
LKPIRACVDNDRRFESPPNSPVIIGIHGNMLVKGLRAAATEFFRTSPKGGEKRRVEPAPVGRSGHERMGKGVRTEPDPQGRSPRGLRVARQPGDPYRSAPLTGLSKYPAVSGPEKIAMGRIFPPALKNPSRWRSIRGRSRPASAAARRARG